MEIQEFERRDFSKLRVVLPFSDNQDCDTRDEFKIDQIE